ncbi:MAG TPA: glycerophosphodiester phosphodiesterase [Desulfuromonadales bacterium]|nr:glycerophosphodiester phosphodiesterase [Desulfuromonadales bacterium]
MPISGSQKLPLIIGHRGASREAPENTLESFRLAWSHGADGIEADFRLTADGAILCMHDASTGRTTCEDLEIAASTAKELRRLDAGAWKGSAWSGAGIPTLDEVLAAVPPGTWFFIELKSGVEIIAPLKRALQRSGVAPERIRLLSFNAPLIAELTRYLPDWDACLLCDCRHSLMSNRRRPSRADVLEMLTHTGACGVASADRAFLDRDLVDALKDLGKEIHAWTVDRPSNAQRLCNLGVDSITTNRPGWLRQKLAAEENLS